MGGQGMGVDGNDITNFQTTVRLTKLHIDHD